MSSQATITGNGAVLLGNYLACDAFDESRPLRVVTHAHADHMVGLSRSLKRCEKTLMTGATKDLIDVMLGPSFLAGGSVESVDYERTVNYGEEQITFFRADHILGAAQVLVQKADGARIAFTGDFRVDETPILETDCLVIDATYGSPYCRRSFHSEVRDKLVSIVEKGLRQGLVHVFGYHGKLQEVMQILHADGVRVPFVMPERVFQFSKVCEQHGMHLGQLMISEGKEAMELLERNASCVAFHHIGSRKKVALSDYRVCVSGWEFGLPCRQTSEKEYVVALSDHSDFDGLIEYIRRSKPKLVITDTYRGRYAEEFAKEVSRRFGIPAKALPQR